MMRIMAVDIRLQNYIPHWDWLPLQFLLGLGPLIYFYVLKITQPKYRFRCKDMLHFSPLLLEQAVLVCEIKESGRTGADIYATQIYAQLNPVLQLVIFISLITYLYRSHQLIQNFYRRLQPVMMDRSLLEFRWLRRLLAATALLWVLWILYAGIDYFGYRDQPGVHVYYSFYIFFIVIIIWTAAAAILKPQASAPGKPAPAIKPLSSIDLKQKSTWLKKLVLENHYYRDQELTLTSLAEKIGAHPQELSRIINIALKKNFNDLINEYRVRDVVAKMHDPAYDRITLLGMAFDAGFNSKATFIRVFKQLTGKTPAEYKRELGKEVSTYFLQPYSSSAAIISSRRTTPTWSHDKLKRNYMFRNYLKIGWRNIIRSKAYSAINVADLTIGIAAFLLIFLVVKFELSFDNFQAKNIYRITTHIVSSGGDRYSSGISAPAVDMLRLRFPQAKVAGINLISGNEVTAPGASGNPVDDKKFIEHNGMMFAEPQLFEVLSAQWLAGGPSALKEPNMVVLDESHAVKYFGDWHKAMGKTLHVDNLLTLKVAGILHDSRENSDFRLKVLISYITWKQHGKDYGYENNWNSTSSDWQVFVRFPENVLKSTIDRQLLAFSNKQWDNKNRPDRKKYAYAQPLSDMHFNTEFSDGLGDHVTSMATLRTLSFIAILIVVMASINFINLSTAQSVGRSREVGVRKVLGSSRGQLIAQTMGETTMIVLISAMFGVLLAELALPFLKNIASVPDSIGLFDGGTLLCLVVISAIIIIISGVYPALIVSGFKPVLALKNKINAAAVGGISLRRILVITQFSISQMLIIGTVIAIKQMNFVNNADLGFDKNAVVVIPCPTDSTGLSRLTAFKQQVLTLPGIKAASFTSDEPSSNNNNSTNFYFEHSDKDPGFSVYTKEADADYFKTFGLRLAAGRGFEQSDTMREVVINETMLHKLGFTRAQEALGKTFSFDNRWKPIVGVVKDFKTNSLREEVKPIVIYAEKSSEGKIGVKISTEKLSATVARVQKLWERNYPEYAYAGFFLDDNIAKFYKQENQMELLYKAFAVIAIFISCLGLYGLVSFMVVQRTKEIGVRKVLGASIGNIVFLFSKEFLALVTIALVIAMPVGWYMMTGWLQNFAYRIPIGAEVFVIAIAASLLLAWCTVGYKAIKAALANPVNSLRSE